MAKIMCFPAAFTTAVCYWLVEERLYRLQSEGCTSSSQREHSSQREQCSRWLLDVQLLVFDYSLSSQFTRREIRISA